MSCWKRFSIGSKIAWVKSRKCYTRASTYAGTVQLSISLSLSLSSLRCISLQSLFTKISFELISSPFCFSFLHIYDTYSCQHSITIDSTIIDNSRVYIHDLAGPLSISTYFKLSYIQICMYGTSGYWWFRCQAPSERLSEKDTMDTSEFRIWHFVF